MSATTETTGNPITDRVNAEVQKLQQNAKGSKGGIVYDEIEGIGPIPGDPVKFPLPKGGGLLVFRGPNGSGKSTIINTYDRAMGKDVKLRKNELATGSGHFESNYMGVRLKVSQTVRRTLDDEEQGLAVETLDDEFSIIDLVDPREKDPAAADRRGIKAILRVAGAGADISDFVQLFYSESEFERIVRDETRKATDLVQMASMVKANIEAEARSVEADIAKAESEILTLKGAIGDFNPETDAIDIESIRKEHEAAVERLGALRRDRASYLNAVELIEGLVEREAVAQAAIAVPMLELENELQRLQSDLLDEQEKGRKISEQISELQKELELSGERHKSKSSKVLAQQSKIKEAATSAELLSSIQKQLKAAREVPAVEESDVSAAKEKSEELGRKVGQVELIAGKLKDAERLELKQAEKRTLERKATELRDSAKATDGILTDKVKALDTPIKIGYDNKDNPRLIVPHEGRKRDVYFSELSKGEKLYLIVSIAIKAVGPGGMFTIPQELFEGLDEEHRNLIAKQLEGTGVVAVTAQCSGGELRGEIYEPSEAANS